MIFFITVLRALAAIIITNAHYTGVYPSDIIANGGLWGDVIFFAVSGFCLVNVKQKFGVWYSKRLLRCYIAAIIITALYMLIGFYEVPKGAADVVHWYLYPTNYHFIASIVVLYIPFYFVGKFEKLKNNILKIMCAVFLLFVLFYIFFYDKSRYHIDTVREWPIRFLFFESMLFGAYFKVNLEKFRNKKRVFDFVMFGVTFLVYFASKLAFSKIDSISNFQIVNQIVLMALLYYTLKVFCAMDDLLEKLPVFIKKVISYLAEITLEIYVVQYAIIPRLCDVGFFPLNWLLITAAILATASGLHFIVKLVNKQTDKLFVNAG